jgi:DNA-binding MarR family transcriptional regulator
MIPNIFQQLSIANGAKVKQTRDLGRETAKTLIMSHLVGRKVYPKDIACSLLLDRGVVDSILKDLWKEGRVMFMSDGKKRNSMVELSFAESVRRKRESAVRNS